MFEIGNVLDQENLELIRTCDAGLVSEAIKVAAALDRRGRAFASAVVRSLRAPGRRTPAQPAAPAWANSGLDSDSWDQADVTASACIDGHFEEINREAA